METAKRMICEINQSDINLTRQEKDFVNFVDRQTAITKTITYEQYQELDKIHDNLLKKMDKAICWTCNKFVYSGELDVGYCFYHDKNVKESSCCEHHPDYVDGDYIDIEEEDMD